MQTDDEKRSSVPPSRQQQLQVLAFQIANETVVFAQDGVDQFALGLLQLEYFFLHRVARNQPVGEHRARLPDAVRAVHRLCLHRRVPPGIEQKYVLGRRQVQAQTAGLEADQEQAARRIVLEGVHVRLPIARGAVQVFVADARVIQAGAHDGQQAGELRKYQRL